MRKGWGLGGGNSSLAERAAPSVRQQIAVQIDPPGVGFLDQGELPGPQPALDALLSPDRLIDVAMVFVPDQLVGPALAAVSVDLTVPVLADPADQVVGHADVQPAAGSAREDVDPVAVSAHCASPAQLLRLYKDTSRYDSRLVIPEAAQRLSGTPPHTPAGLPDSLQG